MTARTVYNGLHRNLVLAFDVGTTFSGISYSILDPGKVPEIRGVTRFPAQEHVGGDSKIPTVVYYDEEGNVCAVGAEAMCDGVEEDAEDKGWTKAEWFKLHLRPKTRSTAHVTHDIPPLPECKSALEIFADFLRYLHQCSRTYIEETHPSGTELWKSLEARTEFVLTHPNGWEGKQQSLMRKAAIMAGLIPNTQEGYSRLSFVTEGEASLHFCIQSGLTSEAIQSGKGILIVDAGGGTIDVSAYRQISPTVELFEEIAAPQCHFQGSVFVTSRAGNFLRALLQHSKFSADVPHITKTFDKTTKLRFRSTDESQYIKFGSIRDREPKLNIKSGQLKIPGSDVASFFNPSVECIINAIADQCISSTTGISSVFLVGGFAASNFLYGRLRSIFAPHGLNVSRPDGHVNKVVADGAVSFYIDHFVIARVSKSAYGVGASKGYQPWNIEHSSRSASVYRCVTGHRMIGGIFHSILPKNTRVSETQEFRQSYKVKRSDRRDLGEVRTAIYCYRGTMEDPEWMDTDSSMFSILCHVRADTSPITAGLEAQTSDLGKEYYELCCDVVLLLGLTELKAHICWDEHGIERRSPAEVVYDPDTIRKD